MTWGVCENGKNAGKEFFKCCRNLSEFSPCRFFIWKDTYIEDLRSSRIMSAVPSGVFETQIESAPALPSSDSLVEVLNHLCEMNEGIADIREGVAEARSAYKGFCSAKRTTRIIALTLVVVWIGCVLAKFIQM